MVSASVLLLELINSRVYRNSTCGVVVVVVVTVTGVALCQPRSTKYRVVV